MLIACWNEATQALSVLVLKFNYLNPGLTTVLWVDCATQYDPILEWSLSCNCHSQFILWQESVVML